MPFETFEHTADLGLRIWADDLNALFASAAEGLFSLIVPDLETVEMRETVSFELAADELEYLLFDWLNELLYTFEVRRLLLRQFDVSIKGGNLRATARGEELDLARHQLDHEVKAITYHGLKLGKEANLWRAEVIVDI